MPLDFVGHEIKVGHTAVYLKNTRTGSSTIRKMMYQGVVTYIKETRSSYLIYFDDVWVYPHEVVMVDYDTE